MKDKLQSFSTLTQAVIVSAVWTIWLMITFHIPLQEQVKKEGTLSALFSHFPVLILSFLLIYLLTALFRTYGKQIGEFVYRYRYLLAGGFILLTIIFQISGSSIGMWADYIGGKENDQILLGMSRALRSDEWGALTSFTFSQANGLEVFPYFSQVVRGTQTDMAMVYAQPIWGFITLFRPAYYGYLLFGLKGGLAFFWSFRQMFMLLTLFELGMRLSKKKRLLSISLACLLTYGPLTQWWFAVNGIAEIFAAGSLAVLIIDAYMKTNDYRKRFLLCLALIWAGGVYILSFYPAWQVPLAYVFLILSIYIIWDNYSNFRFELKKDLSLWGMTIFMLGVSMGCIFLKSMDTIQAVLHTVYPGNRVSVGREGADYLFDYPMSIFYSWTGLTWERGMDVFYDFFPFSTIYGLIVYQKTKDKLLLLLLSLAAFFFLYFTFGFPLIVAKITLMSLTTGVRAMTAFGFVNILLVTRALSLGKKGLKPKWTLACAGIVIVLMVIFARDYVLELLHYAFEQTWDQKPYSLMVLLAALLLFAVFHAINQQKEKQFFKLVLVIVSLSGLMVNPIRVGTDVIDKNPLIEEVKKIRQERPKDLWIVESLDYPRTNLTILAGAPTINSTNTYPNMKLWHRLDPDRHYEKVYNRYAHIRIEVTSQIKGDPFELMYPDVFKVQLTPEQVKELNIRYIVSQRLLEDYSTESVQFTKVYSGEQYFIYQVKF